MKQLLPCLLLLFAFSVSAQSDPPMNAKLEIEIPDGPKPWTSLDLNNKADKFQFAIVTDRTGSPRAGIFMEGVKRLNMLQPEFVMSVGDLIQGYTEDMDQLKREWKEFNSFVAQLTMPFFYVPGNHDITNQVMEDLWKKQFGKTHYHFKYKDVLFMCLNSEDQKRGAGRGTISDDQYKYIEKTLADNEDVRWTLIFMHQPLWKQEDTKRWADVEKLLQDRKHTVFVGHEHRYARYERNNGKYFILATTGGGSSLRGAKLGEFDHLVWVTMTEEGPVLANLELSGIYGEDVSTEQSREFLNTVWDSNPIKVEPLFVEDTFAKSKVKVRFTNDKDFPMNVRMQDRFSWDTKSDLPEADFTVPPNDVKIVEVEVEPRKDKAVNDYEGVDLKMNVEFEGENVPDVNIPFEAKVAPVQKYSLKKLTHKVTIDGDVSEWKSFPHKIESDDNEDLSAAFNLGYDEKNLYVAIKVTDDDVQVDTSIVTWQLDYIGFVANAFPLMESAMNRGSGWFEESVFETISPATETMPATVFYGERKPTGTVWESKAVDGGYVLEAAISLDYLKEVQGGSLETVRINVLVQDRDEEDERRKYHYWQPNWRSGDNKIGSGMFFFDKKM